MLKSLVYFQGQGQNSPEMSYKFVGSLSLAHTREKLCFLCLWRRPDLLNRSQMHKREPKAQITVLMISMVRAFQFKGSLKKVAAHYMINYDVCMSCGVCLNS